MNQRFNSWLLAIALSTACAGVVAYLNLMTGDPGHSQPAWLIRLHVGCAFVGMVAITRFIQGAPAAFQEPTTRSAVGQGFVASNRGVGVVNIVVPGKSAFFSTARCAMIFCFVLCLMVQFVRVGKPGNDTTGSPVGPGQQTQRLST
jgi:hypothetical protein